VILDYYQLRGKPVLLAVSVQPLCPLCLRDKKLQQTHTTETEQHSHNQTFPAKAQRSKDNVKAILFSLCSFAPLRETFLQKQELANLLHREHRGCIEKKIRTHPLQRVVLIRLPPR